MSGSRTRMTAHVIALVLIAGGAVACGTGSSGGASASGNGTAPATDANVAGDIPDNQAFVTYSPTGGAFSVQVPEGWARSSVTGGVAFSDKYNRVAITSSSGTSAPTVQSVTQVDVPQLKATTPGFDRPQVSTVGRTAGPAVLLTYLADSAPNTVTGKVVLEAVERYTFARGTTTVTLTLAAPRGSDNVDPWRKVTDSFRWAA